MKIIWKYLIEQLIKNKLQALVGLTLLTCVMLYFASRVELDYSYTKALPVNDSFYLEFQNYKKEFGADANVMFVGIQQQKAIDSAFFSRFIKLHEEFDEIDGVTNVWSLHNVVRLVRNQQKKKFKMEAFIPSPNPSITEINQGLSKYLDQPLFKNIFYNPKSKYLSFILTLNSKLMESVKRSYTIDRIKEASYAFQEQSPNSQVFISGMPFIRVEMASKIRGEMIILILASAIVSLLILLWCFRSLSILTLAFMIMAVGVVWCFAIMHIFGFNITLLNSLTPTLVVIIGIPNCIYIINKYRTTYHHTKNKKQSVYQAIDQMGFITLLCNVIAAIGFYAFAFTDSPLLIEFGLVAGTSILLLFPIALILILNYISFAKPLKRKTLYTKNSVIDQFTKSVRSICYRLIHLPLLTLTGALLIIAFFVIGIKDVVSNSYIFDGMPKKDKIYSDLKFFETELEGVFNIDLFIESNKPIMKDLRLLTKIDLITQYVTHKEHTSKFSLTITDGLKFLRQSFYDNQTSQYAFPNMLDFAFMYPYIRNTISIPAESTDAMDKELLRQFISQDQKKSKLSFFIKNIGSNEIKAWIDDVQHAADSIINSEKIQVKIGGSGVAFIKGNVYIMQGLKESILLSVLIIGLCILLIYKNLVHVLISIIPNILPLTIILGLLGWLSIDLNPATVIIFGMAFGISNDLTLRIMVAYAYEEGNRKRSWERTFLSSTPSVIFTALVLIFGFSVFCISDMNNVFYIGLLMSVTMFFATLCNIIILPIFLKFYEKTLSRTQKKRR